MLRDLLRNAAKNRLYFSQVSTYKCQTETTNFPIVRYLNFDILCTMNPNRPLYASVGGPVLSLLLLFDLYLLPHPSGISKPNASAMSICLSTNGMTNFAFPLCSMHLMDCILSRMYKEEENISFTPVDFQMYFTYELSIRLTKSMSKRFVLPSSGQLVCLEELTVGLGKADCRTNPDKTVS